MIKQQNFLKYLDDIRAWSGSVNVSVVVVVIVVVVVVFADA